MLRSLNSSFFLFINLFLFCNPRWLMVVTVTAVMWCEVKWSVALAHTHTHLRTHTPSADRLWARCVAWQGFFFSLLLSEECVFLSCLFILLWRAIETSCGRRKTEQAARLTPALRTDTDRSPLRRYARSWPREVTPARPRRYTRAEEKNGKRFTQIRLITRTRLVNV